MKIVNNLPRFSESLYSVLDDALKEGARDGLINARTKAPFDKGRLRADSDIKKTSRMNWRIAFYMEYARFQEFGGDGNRTVRNYSTSGTGKHFLKQAGDEQSEKLTQIFKKHSRRARA